ncbi:MAG: hypothetical protein WDZ76_13405 [Pseudohongiellaceae bacterium]
MSRAGRSYIRKLTLISVAFAVPWILAGCAQLMDNILVNREPAEVGVAYNSLAYYNWLRSAPISNLNSERQRLEQEAGSGDVIPSVQLAVVLTDSRIADEETESRAREVLRQADTVCGDQDHCENYLVFGKLWENMLDQRVRLQLTTADWRRDQENIRRLEDQIRLLEKQIQDLTGLEQQIMERERSQNQQ